MSTIKFDEYRFHFKPKNSNDLFGEENMRRKNDILKDLLNGEISIIYKINKLKYKKYDLGANKYYIKLANVKKTKLEKNFLSTYIDNEPSCNIFIWNDPIEQKILIESDKSSFSYSDVVARILQRSFSNLLEAEGLEIKIRKEFLLNEFWELVDKHKDDIKEIKFKLIYPNLPAASKDISEDLKEASKLMNADESIIAFKATEGDRLKNINKENEYLNQLNSASSTQGNPITIKVGNYGRAIHTGKSTKSLDLTDVEISANNIEEVRQVAEILFKLQR